MEAHGTNQRKKRRMCKVGGTLALLVLPLLGCVYSIQPWYAEGSGGADPALAGIWREVGGQDTWVFYARGDSLRLLYQENDETGEFIGISFRVGRQRFLDLTPLDDDCGGGPTGWYMLPLHGLHAWSLERDTLRLSSLDPEALEGLLGSGPHPAVDKHDNRWIFTGTREEMAAFTERLLDSSLYGEPTLMVRE